ncbi:MAG: tyrosine-protein phosphatase [Chloroflexi bacterium]|uniref:Tyrosine-protein phosphatase n=1 Tax=Candidatus Chlorohelix allophototropha TaxID=3003348 RepID=A0A8T7M824_9CHLR|nr:tyrosine-protein phosphatase [Chloroflexota bacterium]WJW68232.1 tyrosine-protein phosphatase [Chloroflexota bacterium L227-S17]
MLRYLDIEGAFNFRDIGGYPVEAAGLTSWGRLFRSGSLHNLSETSINRLHALGLKTVIDLRTTREITERPDIVNGFDYHSLPVIEGQQEKELAKSNKLTEHYKYMLENTQPRLKTIFEHLATLENSPVLVHCAAGKDRTGLVIALVLGNAGVADETIIEDYALSDRYLDGFYKEAYEEARQKGYDIVRYSNVLNSNSENMANTITYLRERYGDFKGYLSAIGLSDETLDKLRNLIIN